MEKNWYVIYVKPKHEIKVARKLAALKIEVYCPTIKESKVWSDRKKIVEVPLFKSYVFVHVDVKERQSVFVVPGIVRYLFWLGKPALVRNHEIEALQSWLTNNRVEEVVLSQFVPGEQLKIKRGVFKDNNGIIQEVGKKRVKLFILALGVIVNLRLKEVI